jgi:hypothetical protein
MHRACTDHEVLILRPGWRRPGTTSAASGAPLRLPGSQLHREVGTPRKDDGAPEQGRRIMNNRISN